MGSNWSRALYFRPGELRTFFGTGHISRPETLMVFLGAIAHLVLIVACVAAFRGLHPKRGEWGGFLTGGLLVLAYFAAIVAILRPR
jgi:hypothetical protein